ncbi:metallophosphoesterase [Chelativorans sp. AA-79]|uniref:metallophosphoesterase family protein n=1 Tax=Chelativorans sp. AA-79 TaxID=3028735 RepID=UPI0023F9153E|nr:metallophosphoesterase [Chelativorans sp. AA-79]WEX07933.1 metallophosphoesterase [Chelativorans sp. AA-79]
MFRLAHFSDIHLGPLPKLTYRELISKRITGYINWHRRRRVNLDNGIIDLISEDILAMEPDHIALTGDLVNLALDKEIELARLWLKELGIPRDVSVVPGNHDAYVPRALDKACRAWGAYMAADGAAPITEHGQFPYMRVRGPVALIGLSSARATAPFLASGYFTEKQEGRAGELLDEAGARDLFRVILIHHPPVRGATGQHKRLFGISRFQKMVRRHGAELVLHGHTHQPTVHRIDGKDGVSVPVVGVAAAGQAHGAALPAAHYNLLEIMGAPGSWQVQLTRRGVAEAGSGVVQLSSQWLVSSNRAPA